MANTETESADVLDEIEAAISSGRSMGLGAWAILNRVQRLATPTPARSEAAGGAFNGLANVCIYCGCDLDGDSTVGSCEHVSIRERETAWQKKWAAAVDQSGANALRAGRAEEEAASLRQQLAAAREDGERLDWMQEHYAEIGWLVPNSDPSVCEVWETHEGVRVIASWAASGSGTDLRSAIDAARTSGRTGGEGGNAE